MQSENSPIVTVGLRVASALVVVSVPLFLIAASVAWAVNDAGLYRRGFEKYNVAVYSGITEEDLNRVGADLRRYFNSTEEPLHVVAPVYGMERELYNHREVEHMRDVKGLVRGTYLVALATLLYLLLFKGIGYYLGRWKLCPKDGPSRPMGRPADPGHCGSGGRIRIGGLSIPCSCCSTA